MDSQLQGRDTIKEFILAGMATFTIRSRGTGTRFTYRVKLAPRRAAGRERPYFVNVLRGENNTGDYTYLGCIWPDGRYVCQTVGEIAPAAPSSMAFRWLWRKLNKENSDLTEVEFYHAGHCARCGKLLTDPESIKRGFGKVCAKLRGG